MLFFKLGSVLGHGVDGSQVHPAEELFGLLVQLRIDVDAM